MARRHQGDHRARQPARVPSRGAAGHIITHLLGKIPYKQAPREKVNLPGRQKRGGYREPAYPFKYVDERF